MEKEKVKKLSHFSATLEVIRDAIWNEGQDYYVNQLSAKVLSEALPNGYVSILKMLDKLKVSELAEISKTSKQFCSQVKHHKRPASQKLIQALQAYLEQQAYKKYDKDYYSLFLQSKSAKGVSQRTTEFYQSRLSKFAVKVNYLKATRQQIESYLSRIPANKNGLSTRHCSYKTLHVLYTWLASEYGITNPMVGLKAPILSKPILPSLSREEVLSLIERAHTLRDKAIISLFTESGLRLSELANVKGVDIDWQAKTITTWGKGRKQALAAFGSLTEQYLEAWLAEYQPTGNVWGLNPKGISTMLRRLEVATGLHCNPHVFRRTFACLLRKAGVDSMTIKDLGRWESLEMVQRYTRSVTFEDSMKHYKAPLG